MRIRPILFLAVAVGLVASAIAIAADNLTVGSATGAVIRTDDVGSAHHYVIKTAFGSDGSVTFVDSSNGLPVAQQGTWNITNVSGTVSLPTGAATLAEQQTQTTALQLLDDVVATTGAAVPSKGSFIAGTDGTDARALKTDAGGELQVDVLTLPNVTVGAALPAGTNNIGDVDVLTLPSLPAGTNTIGKVEVARATGRVEKTLHQQAVAGVTTEALMSLTPVTDFVNGAAATAHAVTSGKKFRVTTITFSWRATGTTEDWACVALRVNPSGAVAATSPVAHFIRIGGNDPAMVANLGNPAVCVTFPDGIDLPSGAGYGVTHQASSANVSLTVSVTGYEYTP